MKKCSKCNIDKELSFFTRKKASKDVYAYRCRECTTESSKKWYYDNKDRKLEKSKEWYENNKEQKLSTTKKWDYENINKFKEYRREWSKNKRKSDPLFRLTENIKSSIRKSIVERKFRKKSNTVEILGCSFEYLKLYLESKFESWMTWDNYGLYNGELNYGWDIDHIMPLSTSNSEEEIVKLNYYKNLQPLCSRINRDVKRNK
jgi:hypothetical protein